MKTQKIVLLGTILLVSAGTRLEAAPPAGDGTAAAKNEARPPGPKAAPVEVRNLSPMHREIQEMFASERGRVEEWNRQFLKTILASDRIAIQKEIESIKKNGQISVLEIQLRYARSEARPADAKRFEAAIEALRNPKLRNNGAGVPLLEQFPAPVK